MCQPGRPRPHGDSHAGSPGFADFHSAKSTGDRLRSSTSTARARALEQLLERAVRQRPVLGQRVDLEVHALALDHVRVAVGDQLCDQRNHLVDPLGGARFVVGAEDVEAVEGTAKGALELGDQRGLGGAVIAGASDDLVLDVGDVADVVHGEAAPCEVAPDRVERDLLAAVAQVRHLVGSRAADVHRHASFDARHEVDLRSSRSVVEPQHPFEANRPAFRVRRDSAA